MPAFNFNTLSASNVLTTLLNTVPISVTSYNFLIVGNTLIIPLGDYPRNTYTASISKKDIASSELVLTSSRAQDGSSIISQRSGDQIRIAANLSLDFFRKLFTFGTENPIVPVVGIIDSLFKFAYTNFTNTDCIIIDQTGIKGLGDERLRLQDWNRVTDPKDSDRIILDLRFAFEPSKDPTIPEVYEIDEASIDAILSF